MEEIAKELEKYDLDITAMQEIRWKESGEITKDKFKNCCLSIVNIYAPTEQRTRGQRCI